MWDPATRSAAASTLRRASAAELTATPASAAADTARCNVTDGIPQGQWYHSGTTELVCNTSRYLVLRNQNQHYVIFVKVRFSRTRHEIKLLYR